MCRGTKRIQNTNINSGSLSWLRAILNEFWNHRELTDPRDPKLYTQQSTRTSLSSTSHHLLSTWKTNTARHKISESKQGEQNVILGEGFVDLEEMPMFFTSAAYATRKHT